MAAELSSQLAETVERIAAPLTSSGPAGCSSSTRHALDGDDVQPEGLDQREDRVNVAVVGEAGADDGLGRNLGHFHVREGLPRLFGQTSQYSELVLSFRHAVLHRSASAARGGTDNWQWSPRVVRVASPRPGERLTARFRQQAPHARGPDASVHSPDAGYGPSASSPQ